MKLSKSVAGIALVGLAVFAVRASAFCPYEEFVAHNKLTHVGLLGTAKSGTAEQLDKSLACLACKKCEQAMKKQGITNVGAFKKTLADGKTWYLVYFDYKGKEYLKAVDVFEKATPDLAKLVEPHPRAKSYGNAWLQTEWINHLRGMVNDKLKTQSRVGIVTRIKPEKEEEYRTLHQTVWPGVTDQLARSNNRNLSVFLAEIGDEIYEFLYVEYVGKDKAADDAKSKADPCTLRWWKNTDACQLPLPEVKEGIWAGMDALVK
jgi:L-rhamnose mutarotase